MENNHHKITTHKKLSHPYTHMNAKLFSILLLTFGCAGSSHAGVKVESKDIKDGTYAFTAEATELENVHGALESTRNVVSGSCEAPSEFGSENKISYLFASGFDQTASFVLKWDFSSSGFLATEVTIPTNRFYFQPYPPSNITQAVATISYSTDGTEWTEIDSFSARLDGNTETFQNKPLQIDLKTPASAFYYRVEFSVEGGTFHADTFQWERMGVKPDWLQPNHFDVDFRVTPAAQAK
jgi:hypothetical protein